eukprot:4069993-Ditylum_brightwellii.AAC.1
MVDTTEKEENDKEETDDKEEEIQLGKKIKHTMKRATLSVLDLSDIFMVAEKKLNDKNLQRKKDFLKRKQTNNFVHNERDMDNMNNDEVEIEASSDEVNDDVLMVETASSTSNNKDSESLEGCFQDIEL